jgi:hypothetical protein
MEEPKIGVALTKCFICGKDDCIVINTKLTKKHAEEVEKMNGMSISKEPCPECREHMKNGVILISVDEDKSDDMNNPWRTGGWWVIKSDAVGRLLKKELADQLLKSRVGFIEHEMAEGIGLFDFGYDFEPDKI